MTNRSSKIATDAGPESTNHLKAIFEQSLALMREDKDSKTNKPKDSRLGRALLPLHSDGDDFQKRALNNAAKALATLWKISGPKRPQLPGRAMFPDRQTS